MTLHPIPSEFPYTVYEENLVFFFISACDVKRVERIDIVLLLENLHAYFALSAQAWILYKAPQWNARYPNSCPERLKL
jgi:hypothetical protein